LKNLSFHPEKMARRGLAVAGGVILALAFPKFGVAGLAWVAPAILLASALGADGKTAFRLGYLGGCVHHLISLSWLLNIPVAKVFPIAAWLGLSGFISLYTGIWVWLAWKSFPVALHQPSQAGGLSPVLDRFLGTTWAQRIVWTLSCAAAWVAWEMIQGRFLSGFPWNQLGASQYRMLPVIQIASVTGVYGVSFLAVWFAISLLAAVVVVTRQAEASRRWLKEVIAPFGVLTAVLWSGVNQTLPHPPGPAPPAPLKIALIQPSIPQQWIWAPSERERRFQQLLAMSRQALAQHPDLMVWPEAAVPGFVRWETNVSQPITQLVRGQSTWLILGGDDTEPRSDPGHPDAADYYNSAYLLDPEDGIRATYRKRRLVIFGEFLPFHQWLSFLERWTGMGSFTAGPGPVPFVLPPLHVKTSVLICFEDVFPHLTREYVEDDTDFLLNLTNNGWFGEGAAQWQHAGMGVFRAVENGIPIVRCANNGLTCWVDAQGRLHDEFFPGTHDIYGVGVKHVEVPLLRGAKRSPTFYRKYGDVFGWSCVGWAGLSLARALRRNEGGKASQGTQEVVA
jgi:apolipoprotein N-acyltransferase